MYLGGDDVIVDGLPATDGMAFNVDDGEAEIVLIATGGIIPYKWYQFRLGSADEILASRAANGAATWAAATGAANAGASVAAGVATC